jgi:hypothetical protein
VPFDGAIDVGSVNSDTVYLIDLGDTLTLAGLAQGRHQPDPVGPGDEDAGVRAGRAAERAPRYGLS